MPFHNISSTATKARSRRLLADATPDMYETSNRPSPQTLAAAFDAWAKAANGKEGSLSRDSVSVYRDMWMALVEWAVGQSVNPFLISAEELQSYLHSRRGKSTDLQDRYTWKLLRVIDRVLTHHAIDSGQEKTSAVADLLASEESRSVLYANHASRNPLPVFLDAEDARALVAKLGAPPVTHERWQDLRNRAAVALHLGAGLTPLEVRTMTPSAVSLRTEERAGGTQKVTAPASLSSREHETPVARYAWRLLVRWIQLRATFSLPDSGPLFPATRAGKPWSKTGHFDAVNEVLDAAGLVDAGGAFRLRHTFALRQLKNGATHAELAAWLGVSEEATSRYREVIYGPVKVI